MKCEMFSFMFAGKKKKKSSFKIKGIKWSNVTQKGKDK